MKATLANSFACLDCEQIFKLRIELKKHTERKHFPPSKCSLNARTIKSHKSKTVTSALVKSHVSPEKFTQFNELSHLLHWACGCTRCPLQFPSYSQFVAHFLTEHVGKSVENGNKKNSLGPSEDHFDIRRDVITARPRLYDEQTNHHIQSAAASNKFNSALSPNKSKKMGKAREKRMLQLYCKHLTRRPFILHKCANCNKSFTFYKHLREHERGHEPRNHHYCCYCSRRLMSSLSYYRHMKAAHKKKLQNYKSTRIPTEGFIKDSQAMRGRIICEGGANGTAVDSSASDVYCEPDVDPENTVVDLSLSSIIWKYYAICSRSQGIALEIEPKVTSEMATQAYASEGDRFRNDAESRIILEMDRKNMKFGCANPTSHIKSNGELVSKHENLTNGNAKLPLFGTLGKSASDHRKSLPEDSKCINLQEESKLNKTWLCSQCSLYFDDYSVFMQHVKTHEGPIQRCSYCKRQFTQTAGLLSHIKAKHLNTPGYYNKSRIEDDPKWNDSKSLDVIRGQCTTSTNVDQCQLGLPSDKIIHCLLCDRKIHGLERAKNHVQLHNESILRRLLQNTW